MLLTIAGSSCSGKTTAARACADLDNLLVWDFDEIGVPSHADLVWRQRSLEVWLARALDAQQRGLDVLLLGQSPLGEILAAPSAPGLHGIAACLLDVADDVRLRRLTRRDPGRWDPATRDAFVGWAHWHRRHAADPGHRPDVLTTGAWPEMRWDRWADWSPADPRWQVTVVDTTAVPVDTTSAVLRRWILGARAAQRLGRLPLSGDWLRPGAPTLLTGDE
jgi:hypothetical protein